MTMPGRNYSSNLYRYAFNGQEKSSEITDNSFTAEYWQYDSRIGRRWNTDPVVKDDESPYMVLGNNPIVMVDPNGADWYKNKNTGDIEYKGKWHGKHKGYESLGKGNGDWLHYKGKDYNKKTGDVINNLEGVTVTTKTKARNTLADRVFGWANYDRAAAKKSQNNLWDYQRLRNKGVSAEDAGAKYEGLGSTYERYYQAEQDWRAMNYAILDLATIWAPVPKVGMVRWLKPFGNSAGRVFWSGGGVGGKVFAEATQHAWLYGGTTLEKTLTGRTITAIQYATGRNAMTGKLWTWASSNFAKGASGEVHAFLAPQLRDGAFWYTEKTFLEANKAVTEIIPHIIK